MTADTYSYGQRTTRRGYIFKTIVLSLVFFVISGFTLFRSHRSPVYEANLVYIAVEDKRDSDKLGQRWKEAEDQFTLLGLTPREPIEYIDQTTGLKRSLHGRFLHITDIHPDPYYVEGSPIKNVCHFKENPTHKDLKAGNASRFGDAMKGCDASMDLMEYTFKWINETLRDKIDFVVWTGDNVRHDNDRLIPRTEAQIFYMNDIVAKKFTELFKDHDSLDPRGFSVPVVPSLGNNDVFPHNMFAMGPTLQTREFFKLWSPFVPPEQQRGFDRGVSFFKEVISGRLAVISINTLYLYKANPLVDNCNSRKQPGYQQLLWLGHVLEECRSRGIRVWLSGHVPPLVKNFDNSCLNKFTLWTHEYRDIIIGGLYGHMNVDHFVPLDAVEARRKLEGEFNTDGDDDSNMYVDVLSDDILDHAAAGREIRLMGAKPVNKVSYMNHLRDTIYNTVGNQLKAIALSSQLAGQDDGVIWEDRISNAKEELSERYVIVNVAGSVIPTFNPALRVWEYNITDFDNEYVRTMGSHRSWEQFFEELDTKLALEIDTELDITDGTLTKRSKEMTKRNGKSSADETIPRKMPKDLPLGPAYVPQLFTPTRFVQYYADLEQINRDYTALLASGKDRDEAAREAFTYQIEYMSDSEVYRMQSLTVGDYLELAARLSDDDFLWGTCLRDAFISTGYGDT